jgi:hypothetical protein
MERFSFYEEAKTSYAIVATSETALYANIMLQKGVVETPYADGCVLKRRNMNSNISEELKEIRLLSED